MNYPQKKLNIRGFTLIEIMVSISIFAIIMTTGMGALLNITRSYQISQTQAQTNNGIHFALESMVRDLRIGHNYYADSYNPASSFDDADITLDDISRVINFVGIPERGNLQYSFAETDDALLTRRQYLNGVSRNNPLIGKTDSISLNNALFRVVGSEPGSADNLQPSVFIFMEGTNLDTGVDFVFQTFVSQRRLDV